MLDIFLLFFSFLETNGNLVTRSFRGTRWYSPVCGPRQGPVTTPPPFRTERSNRSVNGESYAPLTLVSTFSPEMVRPRVSVESTALLLDYLCHGERRRERKIGSLLASPITQ